jgi:membrane protease YdiL (CAAX protease family)
MIVWGLIAGSRGLASSLGHERATFVAFLASTVVVLAARRRSKRSSRSAGPRDSARRWAALGLAGLAGFCCHPALMVLIAAVGLALGIPPRPRTPGSSEGVLTLLSVLVLAPVFEELLYRERLLPQLARACGRPAALLASSTLFALPHGEAWSVLGTFVVGWLLGALMLAAPSVGLCIAVHAGLNLAGLLADRASGPALAGWSSIGARLGVGLLALAMAIQLIRGRRQSTPIELRGAS